MVLEVEFKPITSLSFRAPGPFGPSVRGPVAQARSLVAHVTAFLGALCQFANYQNVGTPRKPLEEVEQCLTTLFGNNLKVRGPFILGDDGDLYIAFRDVWNVSALLRILKNPRQRGMLRKIIKNEIVLGRKVKGIIKSEGIHAHQELIGIALDRDKKYVKEGYIYIQERKYILGRYLLEIFGSPHQINGIVQLGGDSGLVRVLAKERPNSLVEEIISQIEDTNNQCIVIVATPLILSKTPLELDDAIEEKIKETLKHAGIHFISPINIFMPFTVEPIHLGWSMKVKAPRPWSVAITPGSAFLAICKKPVSEIYREGAGVLRRLGFGTILPIPLPKT